MALLPKWLQHSENFARTCAKQIPATAMASCSLWIVLCMLVQLGLASQYVSFEGASASSVHSSGAATGSLTFAASQAPSSGSSGYWCSSGNHVADEVCGCDCFIVVFGLACNGMTI